MIVFLFISEMEAAQRRIQITARHIEPQDAAVAVDALQLADVAAEAAGFDVNAMSKLLVPIKWLKATFLIVLDSG